MSGIDLKASKSCLLTLLKIGATEDNDETRRAVVLPGTAMVRIDGEFEVVIPEGSELLVASRTMTYELVSTEA